MGETILKKSVIDPTTGELIEERTWLGYDGWKNDGYKFRNRSRGMKMYADCFPVNLKPRELKVLMVLGQSMNDMNMFFKVKRARNSNLNDKIVPMTKDEIRENLVVPIGAYMFDTTWRELRKNNYVRMLKYKGEKVWAMNPCIVNKIEYVPAFMYEAFKDDMDKFITKRVRERYQDIIRTQGIPDYDYYD